MVLILTKKRPLFLRLASTCSGRCDGGVECSEGIVSRAHASADPNASSVITAEKDPEDVPALADNENATLYIMLGYEFL